MLIRPLTTDDMPAWLALAYEGDEVVSRLVPDIDKFYEGFDDYMVSQIEQREAFMALDRVSGKCLGVAAFSRGSNRITFMGVTRTADFFTIGGRLMEVALNQLDDKLEITVNILKSDEALIKQERALYERFSFAASEEAVEEAGVPVIRMKRPAVALPRPASFHYNYAAYVEAQNPEKCPFCARGDKGPPDTIVIAEMEFARVEASLLAAQGRLWGKCVVAAKKHYVELHDMTPPDFLGYMTDVKNAAKALKEVTGAVKINWEIHGNTVPHIHTHLFPRYIDDPYAGGPIDYSAIFPPPYETRAEFDYFVGKMREKLA